MKPMVVSTSGIGVSTPVSLDYMRNPFNVGIGAVVTGTVVYTIEHTFDDVFTLGAAAVTWFPHDDTVFVNATANANSNFAYPCVASRINQTAGTGTVTATYIQAGLRGA